MPEELDGSWEYWTGDPEIEELLAEQASPRGLPAVYRMPGAFHDNRGYGFRGKGQIPKGDSSESGRKGRGRPSGGPYVRAACGAIIRLVSDYLAAHGPDAAIGIAHAMGLQRESAICTLRRKAGSLFKVVGEARGFNGRPKLIWFLTNDEEREQFRRGERRRDYFMCDRRPMYWRPKGIVLRKRPVHPPFVWIDGVA